MSTSRMTRRARSRLEKNRLPMGLLSAMLTACIVTLIGVFAGNDPFVVLCRATISAALVGLLMSIGLGIVNLANSESDVD